MSRYLHRLAACVALLAALCLAAPASAQIAQVAQTSVAGLTGGTSSAIDTTGATLIAIFAAYNNGCSLSLSDSEGNSYTATIEHSSSTATGRWYYAANPTVSSSHTFTVGGGTCAQMIEVLAFSGVATTSPLDKETGAATNNGTSLATGSVTPDTDNQILLAGIAFGTSATVAVDSGFTIIDQQDFATGSHYGAAVASLLQTSAAAKNPSFSWSGTMEAGASIVTFEEASAPPSLTSGTASLTSATNSTITVTTSAASGGTSPYSYQWYRSTTANFTPGGGNLVSGATSTTLADSTGLSADTPYFYKARATDSAGSPSTVTSNQTAGILKAAPLVIYALGDSITKGTAGPTPATDTYPQLLAIELAKLYKQRAVTVVNGGVNGYSAHDFATDTGGNLTTAVANAVAASATHVFIRLGANDAAAHTTASSFKTDLQTIGAAFLAEDITVVLNYPTYIPAGANSGATDEAATAFPQQYMAKIDELVNGTTYLRGDTLAYAWFITHQSEVQSDKTHLLEAGNQSLAVLDARAFDRAVLQPSSGGSSSGGALINGGRVR